jgi:antitoxin YefM
MITTYYLEEKELNEDFLSSVKKLFKDKKLAITIQEEIDETEYLMSSEANKERLQKAFKDFNKGENLVEVDLAELKSQLLGP